MTISTCSYLLAVIGEFMFALAAEDVDEIRNHDLSRDLQHKIIGTIIHKRNEICVVDPAQILGIEGGKRTRVIFLRDREMALVADEVERIFGGPVMALPNAFSGAERRWYSGLTVASGRIVPVLNLEGLISRGELYEFRAAHGRRAGVLV